MSRAGTREQRILVENKFGKLRKKDVILVAKGITICYIFHRGFEAMVNHTIVNTFPSCLFLIGLKFDWYLEKNNAVYISP